MLQNKWAEITLSNWMRMVNYFIAGCYQARNLEFYPPLISPLIFMASSNIILHRFLLSWDFVFVKATKRISMEIWRFVIWYLELYQIRANEYLKIPAIKFFYAQSIILHSFTLPMGFRCIIIFLDWSNYVPT